MSRLPLPVTPKMKMGRANLLLWSKMERLYPMIEPNVKRCAGLDVHKMKVTVTVLIEQEADSIYEQTIFCGHS